jgi:cytochrome c2
MWLGLAFLVLALAAVFLQAWLWGPQFWDDEAKKTKAPRTWLRVHAACGYSYALIYVVMMTEMVPRMWHYQSELPARSVMHATAAIVIGVILITKIFILRFFRHFEEAMPRLGFGLLLSTVVLGALSLPFAVRAHDLQGHATTPENLKRVQQVLTSIDAVNKAEVAQLASVRGLERGRSALVTKCTYCHDVRTILSKPRTGNRWFDVVERMQEKPSVMGLGISDDEVSQVAAYLIAITPDLQQSTRRKRERERNQEQRMEAMADAMPAADAGAVAVPAPAMVAAGALLDAKCTDCHELDELDKHGGDTLVGWTSVLRNMAAEGAEISPEELTQLANYLAKERPKR